MTTIAIERKRDTNGNTVHRASFNTGVEQGRTAWVQTGNLNRDAAAVELAKQTATLIGATGSTWWQVAETEGYVALFVRADDLPAGAFGVEGDVQ